MVRNPPRAMIRRALFLAATAVLGGFGVASGAIPSGAEVIDGCYANKTGFLRVVDIEAASPQACRASETALSWNQRGLKGETGPAGPAGEQGPAGEPGASGGQEVFFAQSRRPWLLDSNFVAVVEKELPAGSYLIEAQVNVETRPRGGAFCLIGWGNQPLGGSMAWGTPANSTSSPIQNSIQLKVAATVAAGKAVVLCAPLGAGDVDAYATGSNLVATRVASVG